MNGIYETLHRTHYDERELRVVNAKKCLKIVKNLIGFDSVIDFGCGIGGWLAAAKALGASNVLGLEGEWVGKSEILIDRSEMLIHDLSKDTLDFSRRFDLCISIEVAEHLPKESADLLCNNLTKASNFVMFSAAIPNQGGVDHVNERPPKYWVDKFWARDFVPLDIVRPAIANEPKMYPWLKQNIIVFMNYDMVSYRQDLARFLLPKNHFYNRYAPM